MRIFEKRERQLTVTRGRLSDGSDQSSETVTVWDVSLEDAGRVKTLSFVQDNEPDDTTIYNRVSPPVADSSLTSAAGRARIRPVLEQAILVAHGLDWFAVKADLDLSLTDPQKAAATSAAASAYNRAKQLLAAFLQAPAGS